MTIDEFISKVRAGLLAFKAALEDEAEGPVEMSEEDFADVYMDWIADNGVGGDAA